MINEIKLLGIYEYARKLTMNDDTTGRLATCIQVAQLMNDNSLAHCLNTLINIADNNNCNCEIGIDFAALSFTFAFTYKDKDGVFMNGGLIFHRSQDYKTTIGKEYYRKEITYIHGEWSNHT